MDAEGKDTQPPVEPVQALVNPVQTDQTDSTRAIMISRLGRVMLFRVVLVTILMIGMVLSNYLMGTFWRLNHPSGRLLTGIIVFLFVASICYGFVIRWISNLTLFFYLQLIVDMLAIAVVVHVTGGAASGFTALYIIAVVAAAVVDARRGAVAAGIGSIVLFTTVSLLGYMKWIPALTGQRLPPWEMMPEDLYKNLGVNFAALGAVILLASYLAEQLRKAGRRAKAHHKAYQDLAAHHEDILRRLDSGIISTDADDRILTINRAARRICSISLEDGVGRPLKSVFPPLAEIEGSQRLTFQTPAGESVSVEVTATRMEGAAGGSRGRVFLIQDRTEFERMEEEVKRAERLAMLGRFAAGVAHEIRNPLASISGSIELLRSTAAQAGDDAKLMDIVVREVERLDSLIGELLDFTRPGQLKITTMNLSSAVQDSTQLFLKEQKASDVQIEVNVENDVLAKADESKIQQVLWNLLRNAADVTKDQGVISVVVRRENNMAALEVTDRGQGIVPEHQTKIFEPFFTTKPNGTGLGLAAVHQIVNDHGGRILVQSEKGHGCTFTVLLPLADADS